LAQFTQLQKGTFQPGLEKLVFYGKVLGLYRFF